MWQNAPTKLRTKTHIPLKQSKSVPTRPTILLMGQAVILET